MKVKQMSVAELKLTIILQEAMGFKQDKNAVNMIMNLKNDAIVGIGDNGVQIITHDIKANWSIIGNTSEVKVNYDRKT